MEGGTWAPAGGCWGCQRAQGSCIAGGQEKDLKGESLRLVTSLRPPLGLRAVPTAWEGGNPRSDVWCGRSEPGWVGVRKPLEEEALGQ